MLDGLAEFVFGQFEAEMMKDDDVVSTRYQKLTAFLST
ncbi:hypothetical protein FVEN_g12781 [Fusarium venenatum]|nr:hypothetical protein FVEN_g12781 [Fusarium venenatum]